MEEQKCLTNKERRRNTDKGALLGVDRRYSGHDIFTQHMTKL